MNCMQLYRKDFIYVFEPFQYRKRYELQAIVYLC